VIAHALRRGCAALLFAAWTIQAGAQPSEIELDVGGHALTAEIAIRPEQLERGLMFRRMLPENRGMLFVFAAPKILHFWMKNTYLPLSIAFINADGVIIEIADMKPQTTVIHSSRAPAKFALEVNRGWFRRHGVAAGATVGGLAGLTNTQ